MRSLPLTASSRCSLRGSEAEIRGVEYSSLRSHTSSPRSRVCGQRRPWRPQQRRLPVFESCQLLSSATRRRSSLAKCSWSHAELACGAHDARAEVAQSGTSSQGTPSPISVGSPADPSLTLLRTGEATMPRSRDPCKPHAHLGVRRAAYSNAVNSARSLSLNRRSSTCSTRHSPSTRRIRLPSARADLAGSM
jgi:hypothetical protein